MKYPHWFGGAVLGLLLLVPAAGAQENPRFEVGPVFSFLHQGQANTQNQFELGARFSYNFSRHVAADGELVASPYATSVSTIFEGGHIIEGFAGVKVGWRWRKWGTYGKLRPGFLSYSGAIRSVSLSSGQLVINRQFLIAPAFDVGGVVEFYLSRRILLRYDTGDTIIRYGSRTFSSEIGSPITERGFMRNALQFSTGLSFRF